MTEWKDMDRCKRCGSYAINDYLHGRVRGIDLDLCDVCYWRKKYEETLKDNKKMNL